MIFHFTLFKQHSRVIAFYFNLKKNIKCFLKALISLYIYKFLKNDVNNKIYIYKHLPIDTKIIIKKKFDSR